MVKRMMPRRLMAVMTLWSVGCVGPAGPQDLLGNPDDLFQDALELNPGHAGDPQSEAPTQGAVASLAVLDAVAESSQEEALAAAVPLVSAAPGTLAAIPDLAGLRIFAVGRAGQLLAKSYRAAPGWSNSLSPLGGPAFTSVSAVDIPATATVPERVVLQGGAGQLYQRVWNASGPGAGWAAYRPLGGAVNDVQVLSQGGVIRTLAVGTNGHLFQGTWNGATWSGYTAVTKGLISPTVAITKISTVTVASGAVVYAVGANGAVYVGWWTPTTFSGFAALAGYTNVVDIAVFRHAAQSRDYIFTTNTAHQLSMRTRLFTGVLSAFTLLPGAAIAVSAFLQGTTISVYMNAPNGYIYRLAYTPTAGWGLLGNVSLAVPKPPTACSSYTYTAWGACQANGTHQRTVTAKLPAGCVGGPAPVLSQACVYTPPPCVAGSPTFPACCGATYVTLATYCYEYPYNTCYDFNHYNMIQITNVCTFSQARDMADQIMLPQGYDYLSDGLCPDMCF